MFTDIWLIIFQYLTLLELNTPSFVSEKINFLIFSFKRYTEHFKLSNSLISEKNWFLILDEHFNNFYSNISESDDFFKQYVQLCFIPNVKSIISV